MILSYILTVLVAAIAILVSRPLPVPYDVRFLVMEAPKQRTLEEACPNWPNSSPKDVRVLGDGKLHALETLVNSPENRLISVDSRGIAWDVEDVVSNAAANATLVGYLGGRPLGGAFDDHGRLILADGSRGLVQVTFSRAEHPSVPTPDSVVLSSWTNENPPRPILFADDVDVGSDGAIYFSDAADKPPFYSSPGQFEVGVPTAAEIAEGVGTGRLLCLYCTTSQQENAKSGETAQQLEVARKSSKTSPASVLLDGLLFANGVCVSHDQGSVLVAETGRARIWRYYLQGEKKGSKEIFAQELPGLPDGISRATGGGYWVALAAESFLPEFMWQWPRLRHLLLKFVEYAIPPPFGGIAHFNEQGEITKCIIDRTGEKFSYASAVTERGDKLYVGTFKNDEFYEMSTP